MVDLAKIRKKAKEKKPAGGPKSVVTPDEKLQRFLGELGKPRFPEEVAVQASVDEIELLVFLLGSERYAIDLDHVAEISDARPATRVPNAAANTVGIFSLRGSIVTLLDIRSKLNQPPAGNGDRKIVVVHDGAGLAAFEVDRVLRPARIERAAIEPQ